MFMQRSDLVRASEYRKTAAQCQQMAETSPSPEDRERWFRIADKWIERAVECEHAAALPAGDAFKLDTPALNRLFERMQADFAVLQDASRR
jgi:hypothetical protein